MSYSQSKRLSSQRLVLQIAQDGHEIVCFFGEFLCVYGLKLGRAGQLRRECKTPPGEVRHGYERIWCRQTHILAQKNAVLLVSDRELRPLWQVQLNLDCRLGPARFVGDSLLVGCTGAVYDWRGERRFLHYTHLQVDVLLHKAPGESRSIRQPVPPTTLHSDLKKINRAKNKRDAGSCRV